MLITESKGKRVKKVFSIGYPSSPRNIQETIKKELESFEWHRKNLVKSEITMLMCCKIIINYKDV